MSKVAENSSDQLLTPRQFKKKRPEVGLNSIYRAIEEERIRHLRIGRKILILASEVEDWPRREAKGEVA